MRYTHESFTNFLKTVPLNRHRAEYSKIKIVEMDLPRKIQALDSIYDIYWNEGGNYTTPPNFDDYYNEYYKRHKKEIIEFWQSTGFGSDCECFNDGLKARIYRTWASLITQIHAGYVAELVFGRGAVEMGTDLDHKGIDFLVAYKGKQIKIQVKKESKRPEIARMHSAVISGEGYYNIWYIVPNEHDYENPFYVLKSKQGQYRESVKSFIRYFPETGTLDRLDNGFIIFTTREFEIIKNTIDAV